MIGYSFVRHLIKFHENGMEGGVFWVRGSPVEIWDKPDARIKTVGDQLVNVKPHYFSVSVLICGTNEYDLCRLDRSPEFVADDLMNLARFLVCQRGVAPVVVCQLLHRQMANRYVEVSLDAFNSRVDATNQCLKMQCSSSL